MRLSHLRSPASGVGSASTLRTDGLRSFAARRRSRGLTLVEVLIASLVLAILCIGLLATLIQSRNLTEGSIYQNSANTIMQGYVEQIKNMEFADLPYTTSGGTVVAGSVPGAASTLLTRGVQRAVEENGVVENVTDPLIISTSTSLPDASKLLEPGLPAGVVDNIKTFDINNTPNNPNDDLRLRIWIWIRDMTDASADATLIRGITILYSWQPNNDGATSRAFVGTVRSMRSAVPTF